MRPPAGPAAPPRRLLRVGPAAALLVGVLAVHGWLAALLVPAPPRTGLPGRTPVLLRTLAVPGAPLRAAAAPGAVDAGEPGERERLPDRVTDQPPDPAADRAAERAARPGSPGRAADASAPRQSTAPASLQPVAPAVAAPVVADAAPAATTDDAAPRSAVVDPLGAGPVPPAEADGDPPPLYATRVPPPVALHYALVRNGRAGSARLAWQHDGEAYRLALQARLDDGRPVLAQASTGGLDAHGLAPERFVDRRAGGSERAANFRRDIGRIAYSGPTHQHPAWPGAQDRLSWLAQLAAILAAAGPTPGAVQLFVADATGQAGTWRFERLVDGAEPLPGVPTAQHWRREPPRPEGLRIDLWLAPPGGGGDASAGWPLRLRWSVPRSGDVLELTLQPARGPA